MMFLCGFLSLGYLMYPYSATVAGEIQTKVTPIFSLGITVVLGYFYDKIFPFLNKANFSKTVRIFADIFLSAVFLSGGALGIWYVGSFFKEDAFIRMFSYWQILTCVIGLFLLGVYFRKYIYEGD
jgi:hypothetical protein